MSLASLLTRIVRQSAVYGLADFVGKAVGFLLIPLYTRALSPEAFGQLQVLFLFQTFGVMFLGLGQVGTLLRYHAKFRGEEERRRMVRAAVGVVALASGGACLLATAIAVPTAAFFLGDADLASTFRWTLLGIFARVLSDLPLTLLRLEERTVRYGVGTLFRLFLSLVLIVYFVVVRDMGVLGVILGDVIASLALFVSLLPILLPHLRRRSTAREPAVKELLSFGWPYMLVNLGAFGLLAMDRLFLAGLDRLVEAGIYSLGSKLVSILNVLVLTPFTLVWGPMSFRLAEENPRPEAARIYARLLTYFAYVLYTLALGLYLFSPEILAIAGPPEYAAADRVVPLLLASMVLYGLYKHFQVGLAVTGKSRDIAVSFLVAAAWNLGGNALLVPTHGMMGAALATLSSYLIMDLFVLWRAKSRYPVPYEWRRLCAAAALTVLLALPRGWLDGLPTAPALAGKALLGAGLPLALFALLPPMERRSARAWLGGLARRPERTESTGD